MHEILHKVLHKSQRIFDDYLHIAYQVLTLIGIFTFPSVLKIITSFVEKSVNDGSSRKSKLTSRRGKIDNYYMNLTPRQPRKVRRGNCCSVFTDGGRLCFICLKQKQWPNLAYFLISLTNSNSSYTHSKSRQKAPVSQISRPKINHPITRSSHVSSLYQDLQIAYPHGSHAPIPSPRRPDT